jgi:hypothetical protein
MLAVAAFVAFWVILAVGLFLLAARPGRGRGDRSGTRSAARTALTLFLATAAVFGIAIPILMLTGNHDNASAQIGGIRLNAAEKSGRELFGQHCGVCHTLAASNSVGKVGPDLDILKPSETTVLNTIANGCLPNASGSNSNETCLGQGVMPSQVVQGRQAQDVAQFVAKVAGNE